MPKKPLRNSAKALIIRDDKVLCTRNRDLLGDFYLLPGGGQDHGETLKNAVMRECHEEIGARIEVGSLYFVREYISANHELAEYDNSIHQIEFMFLCRLLEEPASSGAVSQDAMQTGIEWLPIAQLEKYRFYPGSLIGPLKQFPPTDFTTVYLGDTL
ncbi:MAG: NUDIX hydrolase [Candidatus Riflebacteria bacterium HGW-Riflebacteria-2]|nr:MAG: NUDIX hydrolase [Candidatus Riflebacteria bacterium HGW-Riflebacteria-2]